MPVTSTTCGEGQMVAATWVRDDCGVPPRAKPEITRQRALELSKIALDCMDYLEKNGLDESEWCVFGNIIKDLHTFPNSKKEVKKGKKRAASK